MSDKILTWLFFFIPTALLSRIFGWFASLELPGPILGSIITWYISFFGINMDQYSVPAGGFKTLDAFFTRSLKPGSRPLADASRLLISPVDARIDSHGTIQGNTILQAKGVQYSLNDLVPTEEAQHFIDGSYVTLYLSPSDYHRIHSHVNGRVTGCTSIPGRLYTVQEFMVRGLPGLFAKNERLITFIETPGGLTASCKIGAMNVGKISVTYAPLVTNRMFRKREDLRFPHESQAAVKAGDEIGSFHMGSTVILLFPRGMVTLDACETGKKVLMGQPLGTLNYRQY